VISPQPTARIQRLALLTDVLPAALYASVIFYAGLIRLAPLPEMGFVPTDKALHALTFGGLALLLVRAIRFVRPKSSSGKRLLFAVLLASFMGGLLEVCQLFVPYRSAEFLDWLADTVGAAAAVGLLALLLLCLQERARG
jgi:VanZ family protein